MDDIQRQIKNLKRRLHRNKQKQELRKLENGCRFCPKKFDTPHGLFLHLHIEHKGSKRKSKEFKELEKQFKSK